MMMIWLAALAMIFVAQGAQSGRSDLRPSAHVDRRRAREGGLSSACLLQSSSCFCPPEQVALAGLCAAAAESQLSNRARPARYMPYIYVYYV